MLEWLQQIDQALFYFINVKLANPVTDFIMPIITNDNNLRIAYIVTLVIILIKGSRQLRLLALFAGLTLLLTDQIAAAWLKPLIARPRPCHTLTDIRLLVGCGAGYSMPSAHAANAFGQLFVFGLFHRKTFYILSVVAVLIALSRPFVGVHYPFDILVGAILGAAIGALMYLLFMAVWRRLKTEKEET